MASARRSFEPSPAYTSGSSTLCSAVARGSRLKVWKTKPISLFRMRASSSSSSSETRWPLSQYSPAVGLSRQPIRFISVDLPEPDGPMMATNSFFLMVRSTPAKRVHDLAAHVVVPPEIAGDDDGIARRVGRQHRHPLGGIAE